MPYDGNGTYSAPASSWNPAIDGTDIDASDWISLLSDLSTALSTCLLKDGQSTPTASIPMAGFKLTGLGAGSAAGNSVRYEQITTGGLVGLATATVAAHATTMNPWVAREIVASGGAVTLTDIADAPYVGAVTSIYMNAAHIWTDSAPFSVQGNATYTATIGDWVDLVARSAVDAFDVFIRKADGTAVASRLAAEQATTSGTSIDFTGIPSGVKRITVMFKGVSTNGTSLIMVQIGDSGGIEPSGYLGTAVHLAAGVTPAAFTTGFGVVGSLGASSIIHGAMTLAIENSAAFSWTASGGVGFSDAAQTSQSAGSKSLSAELDRVRITTVNGSDAFDAGAVSLSYE